MIAISKPSIVLDFRYISRCFTYTAWVADPSSEYHRGGQGNFPSHPFRHPLFCPVQRQDQSIQIHCDADRWSMRDMHPPLTANTSRSGIQQRATRLPRERRRRLHLHARACHHRRRGPPWGRQVCLDIVSDSWNPAVSIRQVLSPPRSAQDCGPAGVAVDAPHRSLYHVR
jgi:hypothetical protein